MTRDQTVCCVLRAQREEVNTLGNVCLSGASLYLSCLFYIAHQSHC